MLAIQQHELLVSGQTVDPKIYQATVFSTGAALTLVAWDALLSLDDEIDCIWSGSGRAQVKVKWIYLITRWFGLVNQIGIQIWRCFAAARAPLSVSTCEVLFVFEGVTFQLLQLCLDAILVLQIWAVYQRRRRYVATTLAIVFVQVSTSITTQIISVPKSAVDGTCMIRHTPITTTCLGIGMMVSQMVLLSLIFRGKALLQPVARRSKLITVVVRDGMLVFGVVIGIMMISCLYFLFNEVVINVFVPWTPVVPSILTPRIILNMQMAAESTESVLDFTTDLGTAPNVEMQPASMREAAAIIREQHRDQ